MTKLIKNPSYKETVLKVMNVPSNHPISDTVNLQEENPRIFIGSALAEKTENEAGASPPFYITLTVHEQMIHNCLLDSGASHNLMPKAVMEALGLSITKPYHDLYAFDSRAVKCLGVIKDMVVSLAQLPMKSVIMDVVVADITPKFGLLLSRSWEKKVGGTLQMDLSYATIPVFGGENRRLYRELQFAYIVTDDKNPTNHPLYSVDKDLGTCMLHFSGR